MPGGTLRHGWEEPVRGCEAQRTGSGLGRRKPEFYARLGPDLALRAAVLHQPLPSLGGQGQGQAETGCGGRWAQRSLPSSSLLRPHCWSPFAHLARCQGCPGQQSSTQEIGSLCPQSPWLPRAPGDLRSRTPRWGLLLVLRGSCTLVLRQTPEPSNRDSGSGGWQVFSPA